MKKLMPPLSSIALVSIGNSLIFTILIVAMNNAKASVNDIGALTTAYFIGFAIGSFNLGRIIIRVGHIRAFSTAAAVAIITFLLHGLFIKPIIWVLLRFINGIAVGGMLLVVESWLISQSADDDRGKVFAFYMIAIYGAYAFGQYIFEYLTIAPLKLFSVCAICCALAIIPLGMTKVQQPTIPTANIMSWRILFKITQTALLAALCAGLLISTILGLMPLFFIDKLAADVNAVGGLMAATLLGGIVLQYPLGKLSDKLNRPLLLAICCFVIFLLSLSLVFIFSSGWLTEAILLMLGGFIFSIYPISVSHACDKLTEDLFIPGSQSLLLVYSVGAATGPLIAPVFMREFKENGILYFMMTVTSLLAVAIIFYGLIKRKMHSPEQPFVSIPAGVTPVITAVDPRGEENTNP